MLPWLTLLFLVTIMPLARGANLPPGFVESLIAQDLDPTNIVLAPDGRVFITIKSGRILIVENNMLLPAPFLTLAVDNFNERGLGHMVLDPQFETNHFYYVYYTVPGQNRNRVSRFTANGNATLPGSEVVLITLNEMPGTIHNAGAMAFGADGKLYVGVGDGGNANASQDKNSLLGKVLRLNTNLTDLIPTDNPFVNDNTFAGINKAIFALGFRNPYSMDIQPGTGRIFVGDVGGAQWEEINEVMAGKNYGWPGIEGRRTTQTAPTNYQDPLFAYPHSDGCAIVGAAFYNPATQQFPGSYVGKFFYADYCNGYIRALDVTTGTASGFATNVNRAVAIRVAADGSMYYLARAGIGGGSQGDNTSSTDGSLWKVNYTGSGAPFISVQPQPRLVPVGESPTFGVTAIGAAPLQYQWQREGVDIVGATQSTYRLASATLADDQNRFRCRVTNTQGSVVSNEALLTVTTNTRPVPVISLPAGGSTYRAGESIAFAGTASDAEDGTLLPGQLTWRIDFHHDTHTHPGMAATNGITSGSYAVPRVGETSPNVFFRIYLTATDSQGLTGRDTVDVQPERATLTLTTVPAGLQLNVDGQPVQTPATITGVVGTTRTLEAPSIQVSGSTAYIFTAWTDAAHTREFTFNLEAGNQTHTARFSALATGNGTGLVGFYHNSDNQTFDSTPDLVRLDPAVNFGWMGGRPAPEINPDNFVVRWLGEVLAPVTATYLFTTRTDDGVRLRVNNQLLVDRWIPQAATNWSASIPLTGGTRYPIEMEYYEMGGEAEARLFWSYMGIPNQVIPASQLFSDVITGLSEEPSLGAYPNPFGDHLTISLAGDWEVYTLLGQRVAQRHGSSGNTLATAQWPVGIYLIKTAQGKTWKVVKR